MFRVKICGVTRVEDALAAVEAGADAIGLNFYEKSPRCVSVSDAGRITHAVKQSKKAAQTGQPAALVGVLVNMPFDQLRVVRHFRVGLTAFQLHGDEPPLYFAHMGVDAPKPASPLPSTLWTLIRARRLDDRGVAAIAKDLAECAAAGRGPDAVLIDSATPGRYGGTGETVSWVGLADHKRWLGETPLILAGGLTPDNVAEAIRIVRPAAVDVASGVESLPGKKDPVKVRDFVANALGAFAALEGG